MNASWGGIVAFGLSALSLGAGLGVLARRVVQGRTAASSAALRPLCQALRPALPLGASAPDVISRIRDDDGSIVRIRGVLLDLDGTLVDSAMIWFKLLDATARHFGFAPISFDAWSGTFGQPMEANIERFMNGGDAEAIKAYVNAHYGDYLHELVVLEGAHRALRGLQAVFHDKIALVTNCPRPITLMILAQAGMEAYFGMVCCAGDSFVPAAIPVGQNSGRVESISLRAKPESDLLDNACALLGISAREALFVGDSRFDMLAGAKAGAFTVGLGADGGDCRLAGIAELLQFLSLPDADVAG